MLEVSVARSGEPTLSYNSRLLASGANPRREAQQWVQKHLSAFIGLRSAIIISAGAGYHLVELKKQCPHLNIVCLEPLQEIIRFHAQNLEVARCGIKILELNLESVFDLKEVRDALQASYRVVIHPSAFVCGAEGAAMAKDILNGRTAESFQKISALRAWPEFEIRKRDLISIKDVKLKASETEQTNGSEDTQNLLPILEELLK